MEIVSTTRELFTLFPVIMGAIFSIPRYLFVRGFEI